MDIECRKIHVSKSVIMPVKTQNIKWAARALVSSLLIGFFFANSDVPKVALSLQNLPPSIIFWSAALYIFAFLIASAKWKILLPEYPLSALFKLNLIGLFYSTVLPGQISGELVKAYRLSKNSAEAERIVASVWVDKITGLFGLFLVAVAGVFFTPTHLPQSIFVAVILGTLCCFTLLFFIRFNPCGEIILRMVRKLSSHFPKRRALLENFSSFIFAWREYLNRRGLIFSSVLAGVFFQLIAAVIVMMFAQGIGIPLSFWDWSWIFGAVSVALLLPITVGGLGIREGVLAGILMWLHVPPEQALALSLSIFGVQVFGAAIGAATEIIFSRS